MDHHVASGTFQNGTIRNWSYCGWQSRVVVEVGEFSNRLRNDHHITVGVFVQQEWLHYERGYKCAQAISEMEDLKTEVELVLQRVAMRFYWILSN